MDTVTALTLAKMLQIEGETTVSAAVSVDNLIVTRRNGSTFDAGPVRGPQGRAAGTVIEQGYNVDLNDLTVNGFYAQSSNVEAATGFNYPVPWAGLLKVETDPTSTMIFQTYSVYNGSIFAGVVFVRVREAGAWSDWEGITKGPWQNIPSVTTSPWQPYGSTWRLPQFQVQGSLIALRGLLKVYFMNDFNTDVGYGYGPIENLPPPLKSHIFLVAADRYNLASTVLSHNHLNRPQNVRVDVTRDETSYASPCAQVTTIANSSNYMPQNAYCSISSVFWDWRS